MLNSLSSTGVEYRQVIGWPGYRIGDNGEVQSLWKRSIGRWVLGNLWHSLKGGTDRDGYAKVILCRQGQRRHARVASLVLEAFVGPAPRGMAVAHNNGIRNDNRLCNLRWATQKDNCADKIGHGTAQRGECHPMCSLTEEIVISLRHRRANGERPIDLIREYGIGRSAGYLAMSGITWKHLPMPPSCNSEQGELFAETP
jgi:hypothetical protein